MSFDFPSDSRHKKGHEGTDEVEEAVWEVGQSGHTKNRSLGHAAGVPWNEDGSNGSHIFGGATEESGFIPLLAVGFTIHVGSKDNGYELVSRGEIEEETCAGSGGDKTETMTCKADDNTSDAFYHAAGDHHRTETHGAENEPNSVEHARHTACGNKVIERRAARVDGSSAVISDSKSFCL